MKWKISFFNFGHRYVAKCILLVIISVFIGCRSSDVSTDSEIDTQKSQEASDYSESYFSNNWSVPDHDEIFIEPLTWRLHHQKNHLKLDLAKNKMVGKSEMFLSGLSIQNTLLVLHTGDLKIHSVRNILSNQELQLYHHHDQVHVTFDDAYSVGDTLTIVVEYETGFPSKGLMVSHNGQFRLWARGMVVSGRAWIPSISHPLSRSSFETWISVPVNLTTISNGALIRGTIESGEEFRTDYWVQEKPVPIGSYTLAIGEYRNISQLIGNVVHEYYIEPGLAEPTQYVYFNTDIIQKFIENLTGSSFPWISYRHVPVARIPGQVTTGAGTAFYSNDIQYTDQRVHLLHQDLLVNAMAQQWFGNDIAPSDPSSQSILNGIVHFKEYLYRSDKNGEDFANWHSLRSRNQYFEEAASYRRPLISNRYGKPENLLDRHATDKTGQFFRMIYHMDSPDKYVNSIRAFVDVNSGSPVDLKGLSDLFGREYGYSLEGIFQDWFMGIGHPELKVTYGYSTDYPSIIIEQKQDLNRSQVFRFPVQIHYTDAINNSYIKEIFVQDQTTEITLDIKSEDIGDIVIDPYRLVPAEYFENISMTEWIARLAHPSVFLRYEALNKVYTVVYDDPSLLDMIHTYIEFEHFVPLRDYARLKFANLNIKRK